MAEEQASQPKRQRKITEYTQMQPQKHGGMPDIIGEVGNKEPRLVGEEEEIVGVVAKSVEKTAPSQETTSPL